MRRLVLGLALALLVSVPAARASDVGLSGAEGHPRERFPLTVRLGAAGDAALDAATRRAVDDWNGVMQATLGVRAFAPVTTGDAQVTVAFETANGERMMGLTRLDVDDRGVIRPPVAIAVYQTPPRGQTSREVLLYQIVAHELGHALGLEHTRDPRSLMCCVAGSIDFKDAAVRDVYVEARRHPSVPSVAGQLADHYARFWRRTP